MLRTVFRNFLALACLAAAATGAGAQDLQIQPTPFTAWLDFHALTRLGVASKGLPIWIESVQRVTSVPGKTIFRIRFRHVGGLDEQLQLRIFFRDLPNAQPNVTGWTETGLQPLVAGPFGSGLGLDTSETLLVPAAELDYLDVELPGDGRNLRGAFLSSLRRQTVWHSFDFAAPAPLADPFGVPAPVAVSETDKYLFGRVRATIDAEPLKLDPVSTPDGGSASYEFNLATAPLLASLTFEVLGANPVAPIQTYVNGQPIGALNVDFPDLADPAYRGSTRPLQKGMDFRYEGWLRGKMIIPGSALRGGVNTFVLQIGDSSGPAVVRAVEIELKYPSNVFDYETHP